MITQPCEAGWCGIGTAYAAMYTLVGKLMGKLIGIGTADSHNQEH